MRFDELRARFASAGRDPLSVICTDYDPPEVTARAPVGAWVLWHHDDVWDVGGDERGEFSRLASFPDEDTACDYLAETALKPRGTDPDTPEQRAHSDAVTAQWQADAQRMIDQMERDS